MPELTGLTHFDCDPMTDFLMRVVFVPLLEVGDRVCFIFRNNDWSSPPPASPVWNLALVMKRVDATHYSYWIEREGVAITTVLFTEDIFYGTSDGQYLLHNIFELVFRMNGDDYTLCIDGDALVNKPSSLGIDDSTEGEFGVAVYGSGSIDLRAFELWPASASVTIHPVLATRGRFTRDGSCYTPPLF